MHSICCLILLFTLISCKTNEKTSLNSQHFPTCESKSTVEARPGRGLGQHSFRYSPKINKIRLPSRPANDSIITMYMGMAGFPRPINEWCYNRITNSISWDGPLQVPFMGELQEPQTDAVMWVAYRLCTISKSLAERLPGSAPAQHSFKYSPNTNEINLPSRPARFSKIILYMEIAGLVTPVANDWCYDSSANSISWVGPLQVPLNGLLQEPQNDAVMRVGYRN